MPPWTAADIPDQSGRTVVVTGANSGLGLVTARELAGKGARVILAVRDLTKGEQAAATIPGTTEVRHLDLADLASVRAFAANLHTDVLINNAGVMYVPLGRTKDGFELQFGINHLGHFALTNLLLPRISDRVVVVASTAHRYGRIDLGNLNAERRYRRHRAYGQAKLANLLFMSELQRRLTAAGSSVRAVAAHPGLTATNLFGRTGNRIENAVMQLTTRLLAQSPEMGALPTLYAATQPVPGDSYIGPGGPAEARGYPAPARRMAHARDAPMAERLWMVSERLTGVSFPFALAGSSV
jgi:NAD(P)-dependent dehydrogenase (short-subunit alcohol dehydrogenase family)